MKKYPLVLLIFTTFLGIVACREDNPGNSFQKRDDHASRLLEKSKATENIEVKLDLLDSALVSILTPTDTLKPILYDHLIYYYNAKKEHDSAIYFSDLLLQYGLSTGDTLQIAKGYYRKASTYNFKRDYINVLKNTFKAQQFYLLGKDSLNAGKRLHELSIVQDRLGDLPGSQNSAARALSLLETSQDSFYLASTYNTLAITYRRLDDPDEAIEEFNNALRYYNSRNNSLSLLNNLANAYAQKEEFKKSLNIFDSILPLSEDPTIQNRIKSNLYFTRWLYYGANIGDSLKVIMEKRAQEKDLHGLLSSYYQLTRVQEEDSPGEALLNARNYYETALKLNSVTDQIAALDYLVRLAPLKEANRYAREYIRLNDSLMTARDRVKNLFAKIRYDEERKLEEIDELEKLSIQQQLELLKRRNQRNLAIFLGLLILGSAVAIYYFIRQRNKKERIREIHATEARISKKIHDELANDVYNVMTELENLDHSNKRGTVKKLESIYNRTRDISRENTPVTTGSGYREDLQDMLSQSVPQPTTLYLIGLKDISWSKLSTESKIVVHRVLQELMVNMKKHSEASIVRLNFKETSSKLKIIYNDNGKGFSSAELKKGAGLTNVENRIDSIGGSFNFQPETTDGFSAQIVIPF